MRYVLMVVLIGILTTATNTMASCDTDYTCFLLGSTDLLGTREVHLAFDNEGKEIEDSLEVTCDNGEIFITTEDKFHKNVNIMCSESAVLDYPCTDDKPDYSGWCGSDAQKEQYKQSDFQAMQSIVCIVDGEEIWLNVPMSITMSKEEMDAEALIICKEVTVMEREEKATK